jgi:hypothetical protein
MKLVLKFFLLCSLCTTVLAQSLSGLVTDPAGNPVAYASVRNLNRQVFVYSGTDGRFALQGELGDSLTISHISYQNTTQLAAQASLNFVLQPKMNYLKEVSLIPKDSNTLSVSSDFKKFVQYGTNILNDHLFKIHQRFSSDYFLKNIELNIKFSKDDLKEGSFMIQLFMQDRNADSLAFLPLGEVQYISVESLKKQKYMRVSFEMMLIGKEDTLYVFFKRVDSDKDHYLNHLGSSVNPFIYISREQVEEGSNSYLRNQDQVKNWTDEAVWDGYSPSLYLTLNVVPVNEID